MRSLILGAGLGAVVAMQLGPMSLLLIRSTLRGGWHVGLAIGAGIALVDGAYAALGASGAAPLLAVGPVRLVLGLAGAAVLVAMGARTLRSAARIRLGGEADAEVGSPGRALRTALAGTASNPATIASWAAIFAAASTAGAATSPARAALLVLGVALGSLVWGSALATAVAAVRRGLGEGALRVADATAGLAMLGFGGALAWSTLRDR